MCYPTRHYLFSQMDDSSKTGAKVAILFHTAIISHHLFPFFP